MQTYWDLSERERAALSEEQVRAFSDLELMAAGVLRVGPLDLLPVPEAPEPDQKLYSIDINHNALYFKSDEDAAIAARLLVGVSRKYLTKESWSGPSVMVIDDGAKAERDVRTSAVYSSATYAAALDVLTRAENAKAENKRRTEEHEKAVEAQSNALSSMWSDWHACREKAARNQRVIETYDGYLKLCDGETHIAAKFLGKAFKQHEIEDATEWFGVVISEQAPPQCAEARS